MKVFNKYITGLALGAAIAGGMVSCDTLEEKFYDQDKLTEADFNLLFAGAQTKGHLFRYDYGATYHYLYGFGKMLGLGIRPNNVDRGTITSIYRPWDGWSGVEFNKFLFEKTATNYSKEINGMKLLYNSMSEEEKAANSVYMRCCDIIQGYAFQRSTDLYDDIPYFEAGGAFQEKFYAKYDTQEEIYDDIMARLKTAAEDLAAYEFATEDARTKFTAVDMLCKGNLDQWIRMANSLRLRMAMRLCHVKPDVSVATIKELVAGNRMLTEYSQDIGFEEQDKTHAFEGTFYRGMDERGAECAVPTFVVNDIMNYEYRSGDENGIDPSRHEFDPRLYAICQPDIHGRYIGFPMTFAAAESELPKYYTEKEITTMNSNGDLAVHPWAPERIPTLYNRKTYFNFDMDFPVMGSTETNLLLAEAAVRWPGEFGNIDAKECIKKAIDASTRFYYNANATNSYSETTIPALQHLKANATAPTLNEQHLADYKEFAANKFAQMTSTRDKIGFIFGQKVCHMNILNPYEIYNEARRLVKDFDGRLPLQPRPLVVFQERFYYPTSELTNNPDNFAKVAHKNSYDVPVWWTGRTTIAITDNKN